MQQPQPQPQPQPQTDTIDQFLKTVSALNENQYGDFMKRVNLYLGRLQESLGGSSPSTKRIFDEIKNRLVFKSDFNIETTRRFVLEHVRALRGA